MTAKAHQDSDAIRERSDDPTSASVASLLRDYPVLGLQVRYLTHVSSAVGWGIVYAWKASRCT
jgi:hypothetical protein